MRTRGLAVSLWAALLLAPFPCPAQSSATNRQTDSHAQKAAEYLKENRPDLAVPEFKAIVALDPNNVDAQANLGVLLFFQGNYADAIPELRAALKLQPNLAKIQALLGMGEKRTGHSRAAQADLEQAFPKLQDQKIHRETGMELIAPYVPDSNDSGVLLNGITPSQLQSRVGVYFTGNAFSPVSILPTNLFGPGGAIQPESTPGQLGQFIFLHGPMLVDTDISIIKNIPIWERVRFNIYAEFLNAFNHPNFNFTDSIYSGLSNNPAQYLFVNSAPYAPGTVQQNGNRQVQFRLPLAF